MNLSRRKAKTEATGEPAQEENQASRRALGPLRARRSTTAVTSFRILSKGAFMISAGLILLMAIAFAASAMLTTGGAFTIKTEQLAQHALISLSETQGFSNPTVSLTAQVIDDMDNITYDWLPLDELDACDGSHNGENYVAYTFYMKNSGNELLDYVSELRIAKTTRRVDEAVRVMVYRNGVPTIYARESASGLPEPYPEGVVSFCAEDLVMQEKISGLEPDQNDRYTVVMWLEGEDPECVDLVRGGTLRLELVFTVLNTEEETET